MSEIDPGLEVLVVQPPAATEAAEAGPGAAEALGPPLHVYGPSVRIYRAPVGAEAVPEVGLEAAAAEAVDGLSESERLGVEAFALRRSPEYRAAKLERPRDGEEWNMGGCRPPAELGPETFVFEDDDAPSPGLEAIGPTAIATLDGSVAVGIIIVNGPTTATQFTAAQRTEVVAEVQAGLTWLGNQDPSSGISWHYEIQNVSITTATNATATSDEDRRALAPLPRLSRGGLPLHLEGCPHARRADPEQHALEADPRGAARLPGDCLGPAGPHVPGQPLRGVQGHPDGDARRSRAAAALRAPAVRGPARPGGRGDRLRGG